MMIEENLTRFWIT